MIKKFEDWISEGFWKDGIKRAKENKIRTGERLSDSNLYELKEVDLGLSFNVADRFFCYDKSLIHKYRNIKSIEKYIKSSGWRLPTKEDIKELMSCKSLVWDNTPHKMNNEGVLGDNLESCEFYVVKSTDTNQSVGFFGDKHIYTYFMLDNEGVKKPKSFAIGDTHKPNAPLIQIEPIINEDALLFVQFVKDKKPINEGFWKDGIKRAKENTLRKEEGKRVKTALGDDLILPANSTVDYDRVIAMLLNGCSSPYIRREYHAKINNISLISATTKNDTRRYFPLKQPNGEDGQIMIFPTYEYATSSTVFEKTGITEDEYYAIVQYIGKHFEDKIIIDGSLSSPNVYYIGTYNKKFTNEFLHHMVNANICAESFVTLWSSGQSDKLDLAFDITYETTIHYNEIMEIANKFKKMNGLVTEGFWKDGIKRSKSGEERLEDKINSNISNIKESEDIGLSFIISDQDFVYNGQEEFTEKEVYELLPIFEKYGWRLPKMHDGWAIKHKCSLRRDKVDKNICYLTKEYSRKGKVEFDETEKEYWLFPDYDTVKDMGYIHLNFINNIKIVHTDNFVDDTDKKRVRLIKDIDNRSKSLLGEGFWKDGIKRSKNNEPRQEDKDSIFYKENVFPVDGYDGWYFQFEYSNGFKGKQVHIYFKPCEDPLFTFYDVVRNPSSKYASMIRTPFDMGYKRPDKIDNYANKKNLVQSDEFIKTVNNLLKKVPKEYFKKGFEPNIK